ncbi:MAG TPA: sugar ABC transporter permease [Firmicutes bacterium]|nr:sugar ABC transporter permease [Bacillota bacterium]
MIGTKRGFSLARREEITGWLFITPMLIGFIVFSFGPILASLIISFTDWDLLQAPKFVGFVNFAKLFKDDYFIQCMSNTLYFVITMVPIILVVAMTLAIILNQNIRGKAFFRSVFYFPSVVSTVAISMVWLWVFSPSDNGLLNTILHKIGVMNTPDWLGNIATVKPSLVLMRTWQSAGYYMVIFLAGLQTISPELYEVADIDGASKWEKLIHITIPLLSPVTFFVTIMLMLAAFNIFEAIYVMTEGGPGGATNTIMYYIYHNGFRLYQMGYASALAWVLFLILVVLTIIQFKLRKEESQ